MHDEFAVPVEYMRPVAERLQQAGVDVRGHLAVAGLAPDTLDTPGNLLPYPTFRALVLDGLAATREPALGLFVGKRLVASTHGVVGEAAVNSATVRQALDVAERFSRLRSSLITIAHDTREMEVRVVFTEMVPLAEVRNTVLEAVVLSVKNVLDDITMGAAQVYEVAFPFEAPDYAPLARDMFGCAVAYGQDWAGFATSLATLDLPLRFANAAAFAAAERICQRELERIAAQESMSARVRRLLLEHQSGFPSLQVTARVLHMTPRTLHRRLVAEGTSFREVLESVRHTLAVEHVRSGHFTLDEVAYRLGYTDLANFRRAFKRWEGVPPSAYRARQT